MTKNEFINWATRVIMICDIEKAVDAIAAQWESDVNDARIAGQNEGTYMEGYKQGMMDS